MPSAELALALPIKLAAVAVMPVRFCRALEEIVKVVAVGVPVTVAPAGMPVPMMFIPATKPAVPPLGTVMLFEPAVKVMLVSVKLPAASKIIGALITGLP